MQNYYKNETRFEIQNYYKNETRFNGAYSRDNPPKIKNGTYAINLDEYKDTGTHWIALHVKNNEVTYLDSFGENMSQEKFKKLLQIKTLKQTYLEFKCTIQ